MADLPAAILPVLCGQASRLSPAALGAAAVAAIVGWRMPRLFNYESGDVAQSAKTAT
jgi:hypothetical protein